MTTIAWQELPHDLQLEILSFLSLKHLGTLLSLNKSIHDQLDESESFWQQLTLNYAKIVNPSMIDSTKQLIDHDQQQNSDELLTNKVSHYYKYATKLKQLIEMKKLEIKRLETLKMVSARRMQLEMLRSMRTSMMRLATNNNDTDDKKEDTKKENSEEKEIENKLKKLEID